MAKIFNGSQYKELVKKIIKQGNGVNDTYELIGEKIEVSFATKEKVIEMLGLDSEITDKFTHAICNQMKVQVGPFDTDKYLFLVPAIKEAVAQLKFDCNETRRAIIQFPKEHCFQSIQFLYRENTIHIVCSMRSCNAIKNLPYDIWLCFQVADIFKYYMKETLGLTPYTFSVLTMMFGSLHVFEKDAKDVL